MSTILTPVVLSTIFTSNDVAELSALQEQEALSKGQEGLVARLGMVGCSRKSRVEIKKPIRANVIKTKVMIIADFLFMVIYYWVQLGQLTSISVIALGRGQTLMVGESEGLGVRVGPGGLVGVGVVLGAGVLLGKGVEVGEVISLTQTFICELSPPFSKFMVSVV